MKKLLFFGCLTIILQAFLPTAHAQECVVVYDSLHIPTEEIENFTKNNETDVVIKLYYMPSLLSCICQERTISVRDYIQNELDTFPQRLVSVSAEDLLQDQWTQSTGRLHTFLQAILYPERIFETAGLSENPEILETYAFESGDSGSVYVYYLTNKGNYVYYTPYLAGVEGWGENSYLLPEEVIRELYPKHLEHMRLYHYYDNGGPYFHNSVDLSAYKVRGNEEIVVHQHDPSELETEDEIPRRTEPFFPTAAVIAAAVSLAVLGGVTLAAWIYRKKTKR